MSKPKLILIRGIPGSGKSTYAKTHYVSKGFEHYEADMFFIDEQGNYSWDKNKIHLAHQWCFDKFSDAVLRRVNVVISNTFTRHREMKDYINLANESDYEVEIVVCTGNYQNVHNVPDETVEKMRNRFQP